ncbi:MAG: oligosaccharide flippase family protein [Microgenomates group bacterium]
MVKKFLRFLKHPTSTQIIINTIGNYLNVFFTAFFAFLLVRLMNPVDYGTLSVLLGIAYVLANILDLGVSASIYSYLPPLLEKKTERLFSFLKTTFFYQTIFAAIVIFFLFLTFPSLDKIFFKTQAPWWELYLTTLSVLFLIWQNYAANSLLAAKRVFQANLYLNLSNLFKTFFIFILIFLNKVNIANIIFSFGILGPLIYFFLLFFEKKHVVFRIAKAPVKKKEFRFNFTLTYFFASQFFNLGTRMDLFLLSFYFPKSALVGYYGLSTKIILTLFAAVSSITQVLSPDFAKVKTKEELKILLKKSFAYLLLPTGLFFLLFLTPKEVFQIAFTKKFIPATEITHVLALAYIAYPLLNIPTLYFLYTVKMPKYILITNFIFFISISFFCLIFIPKLNAYGGPLSVFFSLLFSSCFLIYTFIKSLNNPANSS